MDLDHAVGDLVLRRVPAAGIADHREADRLLAERELDDVAQLLGQQQRLLVTRRCDEPHEQRGDRERRAPVQSRAPHWSASAPRRGAPGSDSTFGSTSTTRFASTSRRIRCGPAKRYSSSFGSSGSRVEQQGREGRERNAGGIRRVHRGRIDARDLLPERCALLVGPLPPVLEHERLDLRRPRRRIRRRASRSCAARGCVRHQLLTRVDLDRRRRLHQLRHILHGGIAQVRRTPVHVAANCSPPCRRGAGCSAASARVPTPERRTISASVP